MSNSIKKEILRYFGEQISENKLKFLIGAALSKLNYEETQSFGLPLVDVKVISDFVDKLGSIKAEDLRTTVGRDGSIESISFISKLKGSNIFPEGKIKFRIFKDNNNISVTASRA